MPFSIRPYHHSSVQGSITHNAGKLVIMFAVALGVLSITSQASDATEYLCVADKRIGFSNKGLDTYDAATLQTRKNFTISSPFSRDLALQYKYVITAAGESREADESTPYGFCEYGFNDWGILFCDLIHGEFKFNMYNGRFIIIYAGGYDDFPLAAYIETGKCSSH